MAAAGLKAMARTKSVKLGHFIVEFATPGIGHIMKNAGCEFVLFDLEHSGFGFETVKSAIRYFEAAGIAPSPASSRSPSRTPVSAGTTGGMYWRDRASCALWFSK